MEKNVISKDIKEADYQVIKQIEEHAKQYEYASDKKRFLKNVSAYEQKVILLNSLRPYEVLTYLDELDLKSSRLVISQLSYEEIKNILALFTSEDKKNFYKYFSDLSLVNEFIKYDGNSSEHIQSLSFERKVEILDSSKKETIEASSKIYESMSTEEQSKAIESVTGVEALNTLNEVTNDNVASNDENNSNNIKDDENVEENKIEHTKEHMKEKQESIILDKILIDRNQFIKDNIQNYIDKFPELEKLDLNSDNIYELLPDEVRSLIDSDFDLNNSEEKNKPEENDDLNIDQNEQLQETNEKSEKSSIVDNEYTQVETISNSSIVDQFNQAQKECEKKNIEEIKQHLIVNNEKIR